MRSTKSTDDGRAPMGKDNRGADGHGHVGNRGKGGGSWDHKRDDGTNKDYPKREKGVEYGDHGDEVNGKNSK